MGSMMYKLGISPTNDFVLNEVSDDRLSAASTKSNGGPSLLDIEVPRGQEITFLIDRSVHREGLPNWRLDPRPANLSSTAGDHTPIHILEGKGHFHVEYDPNQPDQVKFTMSMDCTVDEFKFNVYLENFLGNHTTKVIIDPRVRNGG